MLKKNVIRWEVIGVLKLFGCSLVWNLLLAMRPSGERRAASSRSNSPVANVAQIGVGRGILRFLAVNACFVIMIGIAFPDGVSIQSGRGGHFTRALAAEAGNAGPVGLPPAPIYKPGALPPAAVFRPGVLSTGAQHKTDSTPAVRNDSARRGAAASAALAAHAADLPPGGWLEIPGTAVRPVLVKKGEFPFCGQIACFKSKNAFYAWTGAAYDPEGRMWYFPAGGGHADYGGNEVYRFDFASLTWARITDPAPLTGPLTRDTDGDGISDKCPIPAWGIASSHTYDGVLWLPKRRKLLVMPTVIWCSNAMSYAGDVATFDPDTLSWEFQPQLNAAKSYAATDGVGLDGLIPVFSRTRLFLIDPSTLEIVYRRSVAGDLGHTSAALHAAHNQLYIVSKALYRIGLPPDEQTRAVKLAPLPQGMHRMTGSAYHPPSGRLVFWPGHNVVHVYDPETGEWMRHESPGPSSGTKRVLSKWIYLPELDVFAGYNDVDRGIWLYRLP